MTLDELIETLQKLQQEQGIDGGTEVCIGYEDVVLEWARDESVVVEMVEGIQTVILIAES
jgi:hypothetical protein